MAHLSGLTLYGTRVTDAGLAYLDNLPHLRRLDLGGTHVTDAGQARLESLDRLEALKLDHTEIADVALVLIRRGVEHRNGTGA